MKLAEQIRKHRKENDLTQDQLATELHTTRQTVSKWEQGTIEPNAQMIVQLAQRFDISTDELLTGGTSHPYKREETQSYPETKSTIRRYQINDASFITYIYYFSVRFNL